MQKRNSTEHILSQTQAYTNTYSFQEKHSHLSSKNFALCVFITSSKSVTFESFKRFFIRRECLFHVIVVFVFFVFRFHCLIIFFWCVLFKKRILPFSPEYGLRLALSGCWLMH